MADPKEEFRARLLATFREEADEHLAAIESGLHDLARGASGREAEALLDTTFREMHTLKGAARSVGLSAVESLCHACEGVLSDLTQGRMTLTPGMLQRLRDASAGIARLLSQGPDALDWRELADRLDQTGPAEPPAEKAREPEPAFHPAEAAAETVVATRASPTATGESIRINTVRLDRLILQSEDLLVPKLASEERVKEAKSLADHIRQCQAAMRIDDAHRIAGGQAGAGSRDLEAALRNAEAATKRMLTALERDRRTIYSAVDNLVEEMRRVRMMPAATMLDVFPRMVYDLARNVGKEIVCSVEGGELEADRKVLEAMKDPLIHLIRNAVDHGIETVAVRRAQGKDVPARIRIGVRALEGARIEITVEDDGKGIDVAKVREAAIRQRLVDQEAIRAMDDDKVLDLVYRSGLSTSPIVTDISGHGLGLAIVADRVGQLNGQIDIENRPGEGARFRINLPASIATFRGLLIEAAGRPFLIPIDAVEGAVRVARGAIGTAAGRDYISFKGQPIPSGDLAHVLDLASDRDDQESSDNLPFIVVNADGQRFALSVDAVLGDREVLLKILRAPLIRVRNVAAAGLLGTGALALVLRPGDLFKSLLRHERAQTSRPARATRRRQPVILVVDDSITTRTMEKNLFEGMGYRVRVAIDGVDAWMMLASEEVDIVVSDVDMPRMNGFDLTARIRADQRLAKLPVVLVTALESREDKEQGIRVGANAYVIKSSLEQTNLQQVIERFL